MSNIQVPVANKTGSLWTPDGEKPLYEKGVVRMTKSEGQLMHLFHYIAQKYNFAVVCQRCNMSLMGSNNGTESTAEVHCDCKSFRFDAPGGTR